VPKFRDAKAGGNRFRVHPAAMSRPFPHSITLPVPGFQACKARIFSLRIQVPFAEIILTAGSPFKSFGIH
jgi:hypothetical protein